MIGGMRKVLLFPVIVFFLGCGGVDTSHQPRIRPIGRRIALWVDSSFGPDDARQARAMGVTKAVAFRGLIDLSSDTPVLKLGRGPDVAKVLPIVPVFGLRLGTKSPGKKRAKLLWKALKSALDPEGGELVLDIRQAPEGLSVFLAELAAASGREVVPLVSFRQLSDGEIVKSISVCGSCIVPLYGSNGPGFRPMEDSTVATVLEHELAPLRNSGAGVRVGIGLMPLGLPELPGWGGPVDLLCGTLAETTTPKKLDCAFIFKNDCLWGGREWKKGDSFEARWMDAARLSMAFSESDALVLPEIAGWDLFGFPPDSPVMGLNREGILAYMGGRGPAPEISIREEHHGRYLTIHLVNKGPFSSALSRGAHWLEISIARGSLIVRDRGSFDRVVLGSKRSGTWKPGMSDRVDAVRFYEDFIGPGEEIVTGKIILPMSRSLYDISYRILLSDGSEVGRSVH